MKRKGVALLLALFTLAIVSLLLGAFIELTTIDLQITNNLLKEARALYVAEGGAEVVTLLLSLIDGYSTNMGGFEVPPGSGNIALTTYPYNGPNIQSIGFVLDGGTILGAVIIIRKVYVLKSSYPYQVKTINQNFQERWF